MSTPEERQKQLQRVDAWLRSRGPWVSWLIVLAFVFELLGIACAARWFYDALPR